MTCKKCDDILIMINHGCECGYERELDHSQEELMDHIKELANQHSRTPTK